MYNNYVTYCQTSSLHKYFLYNCQNTLKNLESLLLYFISLKDKRCFVITLVKVKVFHQLKGFKLRSFVYLLSYTLPLTPTPNMLDYSGLSTSHTRVAQTYLEGANTSHGIFTLLGSYFKYSYLYISCGCCCECNQHILSHFSLQVI